MLKIYFDAGLSNGYCGTGCTNLPVEALAAEQEDIDSVSEQSDVSSDIDGSHLDVEVNQLMFIMFDIFGDSEGEDSIA